MKEDRNLRIRRLDSRNIVVERKRKTTKGEIIYEIKGYYGNNLKWAAISALQMGFKGDNIKELLNSIAAAKKEVLDNLAEIKIEGILLTDGELSEDGDSEAEGNQHGVETPGQGVSPTKPRRGRPPRQPRDGDDSDSTKPGEKATRKRKNSPVSRSKR